MKLKEIVEELGLKVVAGENNLEVDVEGGYASDILSDVMAKTKHGDLWVTNQGHQNVVALVFFKRLAGVIIAGDIKPDEEALQKAKEKDIPVLLSEMNAFEIIGQLYQLGVRG